MITTTHSTQYKIISATNVIFLLLIIPKLNLIGISGYWQGIRVENFISVILITLIIFNPKNFKINDELKFYTFCSFIFLSYSVGVINGIPNNLFVLIRIFEYIAYVIFFSNSELDYRKIILFFKFLIIINFIFCLLQYFDLVGFISSKGYHEASYDKWKASGIYSGPWEVSFITSIVYFMIYHNDKKKINIYFFLTLIIICLANTRGVMIPFFLSITYLYIGKFKINFYHLIILPLAVYGFYLFTFKYFNIDIFFLFESIFRLVFFNQNVFDNFLTSPNSNLTNEYYSWAYRLQWWSYHANFFNTNIFTNMFGTGYVAIYYESFILRILFANGIIGLLVLIFFCLRIKFYMIIFLLLSGLSLDFVVSLKMFIILFLYFKCLKFVEKIK